MENKMQTRHQEEMLLLKEGDVHLFVSNSKLPQLTYCTKTFLLEKCLYHSVAWVVLSLGVISQGHKRMSRSSRRRLWRQRSLGIPIFLLCFHF